MTNAVVERLANSVFTQPAKEMETIVQFRERRAIQWMLAIADEVEHGDAEHQNAVSNQIEIHWRELLARWIRDQTKEE